MPRERDALDPVGIDRSRNPDEGRTPDALADVGLARERLEGARSKVDLALAALPDVGGDEAMATLALSALLIGALTARERVEELEVVLAHERAEA